MKSFQKIRLLTDKYVDEGIKKGDIKTELGNIIITINGQLLDYTSIKLANKGKNFTVDGRYQIMVDNILVSESGEDLALISFLYNNIKLSIGVEGDIPGVNYEYMNDRLRVKVTSLHH